MKKIWSLLLVVLSATAAAQNHPGASLKLSPTEQEVWEQEETYWRSLKADDRETYMQLWDERFVGWPRYEEAPAGKEQIRQDYAPGATVRGRLVGYKLEPLSVRAYANDVVIAFYRAIVSREHNGQAETRTSRLTHTWMKTGQGWKIVGGMSAADDESERLESKLKTQTARQVSSSPEMQKILAAQVGTWSQHEERPDGSTSAGEATWQPGPGGMSLIENEFLKRSNGEFRGLSVTWYDHDVQGYRALWCDNKIKNGCLLMSKPAHWEGDQFVLGDEFESNGKKLVYKEVESGITPTTYTLTSYIGEPGGELKPTSTIHATKISGENVEPSDVPAEGQLRAFMAELRKASIEGDVDTIANSMTDDYVQTDINGYRQDKNTWLNEFFRPLADLIKAGKFHWDEYERKDLKFRFYGDCAIVTGELQVKGTGAKPGPHHMVADPNASFSGTLHFTHVYIKQNGKWMLAALHNQIPLPLANTAK